MYINKYINMVPFCYVLFCKRGGENTYRQLSPYFLLKVVDFFNRVRQVLCFYAFYAFSRRMGKGIKGLSLDHDKSETNDQSRLLSAICLSSFTHSIIYTQLCRNFLLKIIIIIIIKEKRKINYRGDGF